MKDCLKLSDMTTKEVLKILDLAKQCKQGKYRDALKGKVVANLFFEPSTRTQYSFTMAEELLGCKVISFNAATSSLQKGESFYDTVKTFESFGVDALVIRDRQDEYYDQLKGKLTCAILNAGDGSSNHPTQSLLDLMTIQEEFNTFSGLKIAIVGDIKYSRVAHTNIEIMQRLGMECYISGPEQYREDRYPFLDFDQAVKEMDILMLLRVQHERHQQEEQFNSCRYHEQFGLNNKRAKMMKEKAIIMHPAPFHRNIEIADDVVECKQSRIFKQMQNGVFVRMAVLLRSIGGSL